jgi:hypothetical protein
VSDSSLRTNCGLTKSCSGINNKPLNEHQQQESTVRRYVNVVCRLVVALLRKSTHYKFPTSPALADALRNLELSPDVESVHSVCMALWKTSWHTRSDTTMFPDPTMCFTALLHLQPEGHFKEPKDITSNLARLTWAVRLAITYELHQLAKADETLDYLQVFSSIQRYVVDHQPTTFGSLRSLQHFATHVAQSTLAAPKLWWTDHVGYSALRYEGKPLSLTQLSQLFQTLEQKLVNAWTDEVLMGLDLHAAYGELTDNLTESRPGYSCFEERDNTLHSQRGNLFKAVLSTPALAQRFLLPNSQQLNMLECRKWLSRLAEFEKLLMLSIEMTSGAPARGTELTSMLACNTSLRHRNIMALGQFIAIVRQYDKTTNKMQGDRLIPHALSAVNSDLLIQLHVLARPMAQVISTSLRAEWILTNLYPCSSSAATSFLPR